MRQFPITPAQHAAIVSRRALDGRGTFAKLGEDQTMAMRRVLTAARRRPAESRAYPKFKPGMSTAEYVAAYEDANGGTHPSATFWRPLNGQPATLYEGGALDWAPLAELLAELLAEDLAEPAPVADAPPALAARASAAASAPAAPHTHTVPCSGDALSAVPAADATALAHNMASLSTMQAELSAELQTVMQSHARGAGAMARRLRERLENVRAACARTADRLATLATAPAPDAASALAAPNPAPVHPRMAEALAILAAAVAPGARPVLAPAASIAQGPAAPPADPQAPTVALPSMPPDDKMAAHLAQLVVQHVGTDPARLAPALRREAARVASAAARMLEQAPGAGASMAASYPDTAAQLQDMAAELEAPPPAEHADPAPAPQAAAPGAARPVDAAPAGGRLPTHPRRWLRLLQVPTARPSCTRPPPAARTARSAGAWAGLAPGHRRRGPPGRPWHPLPPVAASTLAPPPPIAASARQQGPP